MLMMPGISNHSYPAWERQYASGLVQTFPLLNTGVIYAQPTDNARYDQRVFLCGVRVGVDRKCGTAYSHTTRTLPIHESLLSQLTCLSWVFGFKMD
jgi:hypothetical protein